MTTDPKTLLYGLAVETIGRLREHDNGAADALVEELNALIPQLFPIREVDPDSLWKAYCLMSQAAASSVAALQLARATVDAPAKDAIGEVIDDVVVMCQRSEQWAGLAATSKPVPLSA